MADVPLLTKEVAREIDIHGVVTPDQVMAIRAVATGRAAVCPVRSEAEWRAEFDGWWTRGLRSWAEDRVLNAAAWNSRITILRSLDLVSGEQGGG